MLGLGTVATGVAIARKEAAPIWVALGYFTVMEALQVAGYATLDACGTPANKAVTWLAYLHIVFQPFIINAFAMELVAEPVRQRVRRAVFALCGVSVAIMLLQIAPLDWAGACRPGSSLCGETVCTRSGERHLAWDIPYNGLFVPLHGMLGYWPPFPSYVITIFGLPLVYGAWRFTLFHMLAGPLLATAMTSDPNEMPAIWCLFSVGIVLIALVPPIRSVASASTWWGINVTPD
ncbi:MAG: hypothetical protein KJN93_01895 [Alphaproteobacteria bacterium]|nr:hypothetical protein [Alphaproteobacteria bacterium]NNF25017.1 hypothetical protein [Paracoccaceae bacterium]